VLHPHLPATMGDVSDFRSTLCHPPPSPPPWFYVSFLEHLLSATLTAVFPYDVALPLCGTSFLFFLGLLGTPSSILSYSFHLLPLELFLLVAPATIFLVHASSLESFSIYPLCGPDQHRPRIRSLPHSVRWEWGCLLSSRYPPC